MNLYLKKWKLLVVGRFQLVSMRKQDKLAMTYVQISHACADWIFAFPQVTLYCALLLWCQNPINNQKMCSISMWQFHILLYNIGKNAFLAYFDYIVVLPIMLVCYSGISIPIIKLVRLLSLCCKILPQVWHLLSMPEPFRKEENKLS